MARWTASAKWAEGPALDGRCAALLAFRLSDWLGRTFADALGIDCGYFFCGEASRKNNLKHFNVLAMAEFSVADAWRLMNA